MEDDDFGDLYADLDCQVNAAAAGACGPLRFQPEKGERGSMVGKDVTVGDGDERGWGDGAGDGNGNRVGDLVLEAEDDDYGSESESEDDLRIVLNEEDHPKKLMTLQRAHAGKGAELVVGGGQEEDGDDSLGVVSGFNHLNVEQQPAEGMIQSGKGRGDVSKFCYNSRFIGSQLAGFADTSVVSSSRAVLDHLMIPVSGGSVSGSRMSTAVQSEFNFSLPRTRTIFDINIEAFEQKPWRHHGVDITDYFNYGLNEESWISYWQNVDLLRQEAGLSTRCPSYESSKFQALSKDMARETDQSTSGKNIFGGTVEKGLIGIDMGGRAIQVESSVGERLPSMDLRRSRQRDSDVVIQIKMDSSLDDGCIPYEGQSDMRQMDHPPPEYDKKLIHCMLDEDQSRSPDRQCHQEGSKDCLQATLEEMQTELDCKKGDGEAPSGSSSYVDEAACPFDRDISNSSSSCFDNDSDTSGHSDALNKLHSSNKKASTSSITGFEDSLKFDCDVSDDSKCNYTRADEKNDKINENKKPSLVNYNDDNRSEPKRMSVDDEASTRSYQKRQNNADSNGVRCHIREVKHGNSGAYLRDVACDRERKLSGSYKSRRHSDERSSAKASYRKGIEDADSHRKIVENGGLHKDLVRDYYMTREDLNSSERYLDDPIIKMYDQRRSDDSSSRLGYSFSEKDILYLERTRVKSHFTQDRHRHKEQRLQVIQSRHPSSFDRINVNTVDVRNRSLRAREVRCSKSRDNYYKKLSPDRNLHNIYKSDAKGSRQPDWTFDYEMHVPRTGYEKGQYHSSRNSVATAMKFCDHSMNNHRHFDVRKINNGYGYCLESKKHLASNKTSIEFEYHKQHYVEERYQYLNDNYDKTRDRWISPRAFADDWGGLGHEELVNLSSQDEYYLGERSSRKKSSYDTQYIDGGSKYSNDATFAYDKNGMYRTTSINYCSRDDNRFAFENSNKRRLDVETIGHNEAVIMHLNGLKRKFPKRDLEVPGRSGRHQKKVKEEQNIEGAQDGPYHSPLDSGHPLPLRMEKAVSEFKIEPSHDRLLKMHQDNVQAAEDNEDEIEEGQLIEEPRHRDVSMTNHRSSKDEAAIHAVKKASQLSFVQEKMPYTKQNTINDKEMVEYDEKRILEMLAKMEKRRERFKEPLPPKQGVDNMPETQINVAGLTDEAKLQRPVRKRQWGCG